MPATAAFSTGGTNGSNRPTATIADTKLCRVDLDHARLLALKPSRWSRYCDRRAGDQREQRAQRHPPQARGPHGRRRIRQVVQGDERQQQDERLQHQRQQPAAAPDESRVRRGDGRPHAANVRVHSAVPTCPRLRFRTQVRRGLIAMAVDALVSVSGGEVGGRPTPALIRGRAFVTDGMVAGLASTDSHMTSGWRHHGEHETCLDPARGQPVRPRRAGRGRADRERCPTPDAHVRRGRSRVSAALAHDRERDGPERKGPAQMGAPPGTRTPNPRIKRQGNYVRGSPGQLVTPHLTCGFAKTRVVQSRPIRAHPVRDVSAVVSALWSSD